MKDTKRRFEFFSFFDYSGIAAHLEDMAAQGWLVEKIAGGRWTYRRIAPQKLTFFVSYCPKASADDSEPSEEQKKLYDFCTHTGWKLAVSSAQMQIFYNEQENPMPIETDPVLELETMRAVARRSYLPGAFVLLLWCTFLLLRQLTRDPFDFWTFGSSWYAALILVLVILILTIDLSNYFCWYAKARQTAARGERPQAFRSERLQKFIIGPVILCLLLFGVPLYYFPKIVFFLYITLYLLSIFPLVNVIREYLKRRRVSRGANRLAAVTAALLLNFLVLTALTAGLVADAHGETYYYYYEGEGWAFIAYHDVLPLTVEELTGRSYEGYSYEQSADGTFFIRKFFSWQKKRVDADSREMPELRYTVLIPSSAYYEDCINFRLDAYQHSVKDGAVVSYNHYESIDPAPWLANDAYQLYWEGSYLEQYLLCYPNRIVEIFFGWTPSAEQKRIVAEKLGGDLAL